MVREAFSTKEEHMKAEEVVNRAGDLLSILSLAYTVNDFSEQIIEILGSL